MGFDDETAESVEEKMKLLETESEILNYKHNTVKGIASTKLGLSFLISGIAFLTLSIIASSLILAFIGLGLAFWGMLFFFIRPMKLVRSDILGLTAAAYYSSLDRILSDLKYKRKAFYIPPFPTQVELPAHLKGLKDTIVYFPSTTNDKRVPSIDALAERKFLLTDSKGLILTPPGLGLSALFEKRLSTYTFQNDLESLFVTLSRIIVEDLQLAREVKFTLEDNKIQFTIVDSAYKELLDPELVTKSVYIVGCPLVSAIAIKLAKVTGKLIAISKYEMLEEPTIIKVIFVLEEED